MGGSQVGKEWAPAHNQACAECAGSGRGCCTPIVGGVFVRCGKCENSLDPLYHECSRLLSRHSAYRGKLHLDVGGERPLGNQDYDNRAFPMIMLRRPGDRKSATRQRPHGSQDHRQESLVHPSPQLVACWQADVRRLRPERVLPAILLVRTGKVLQHERNAAE